MNKLKAGGTALALIASGAITLFSPQVQEKLGEMEGEGQNIAYADQLANNIPTVCKGLTNHSSPEEVIIGDYWSDEKCAEVEKIVVTEGQISLASCLPDTITQDQFDALTLFAHNVGNPAACASRAVGLMWEGNHHEGCRALAYSPSNRPVWSYVGKTYIQGLHNRRIKEYKICSKGLRK
jgi:GH24 family phage-related lysozyme (muramidase)